MEEEKENKSWQRELQDTQNLSDLWLIQSDIQAHRQCIMKHCYLGLDYAYLAFEVDNSTLEDAVKGLRALKMVGSNVSMPK